MSVSSDTDGCRRSQCHVTIREPWRRGPVEVPDVDPLDGGIGAEVPFLFEKPVPMTATAGRRSRIGFIGRGCPPLPMLI